MKLAQWKLALHEQVEMVVDTVVEATVVTAVETVVDAESTNFNFYFKKHSPVARERRGFVFDLFT